MQAGVTTSVHFAHAASGEWGNDFVGAKFAARG
jgi:hypothetical protein